MTSKSSTPESVTPQLTGVAEESTGSGYKKPQVAFYPHVNSSNKPQKPFSRSAAKRESVMALGSIEHLQHYFTKTGIAAKRESTTQQRKGLVPAIGGLLGHVRGNSSLASLDLPPSPSIPIQSVEALPYVRVIETDPENLRPGVIDDLAVVERMWHLTGPSAPEHPEPSSSHLLAPPGSPPPDSVDVLGVLKSTTRAVRSVRNYLMSLPDEDTTGPGATPFRRSVLPGGGTPTKRLVSRPDDPSNPLTLIRRSALEVLTMLRALEEACRVPLSDDAYDAQSDRGSSSGSGAPDESHSRVASPEVSSLPLPVPHSHAMTREASTSSEPADAPFSVMRVPGREGSVLVWEEEEDEFRNDSDDERVPRERWDERLVLGSGWLYRPDVTFGVIAHEQDIVARYLDAVDGVLFGGAKDGVRGWTREREKIARREMGERRGRRVSAPVENSADFVASTRRGRRVVSTGMIDSMQSLVLTEEPEQMEALHEDEEGEEEESGESESVDDEDLPQWARRSAFTDGKHARAHAMLAALLPASLAAHLPPPGDRAALLSVLSSGQLLCVAYNAAVRRSRKPWGFISKDSIHDIVALEEARAVADEGEAGKKSWTFRRTDNLRLWAAALKIRYLLPLALPAAPLPQTFLPSSDSAHSISTTASTLTATSTISTSASAPSLAARPQKIKHETPIHFDARVVARKADGWEDMLDGALAEWVRVVVDERRGDAR